LIPEQTESGGFWRKKAIEALPQYQKGLQTSFTLSLILKVRHPGKGDPLSRIGRKPGPSVLLHLSWSLFACLIAAWRFEMTPHQRPAGRK
jgi:hypothetical protein